MTLPLDCNPGAQGRLHWLYCANHRYFWFINSVVKPNFRVSLPHRRSTTVSSETIPLYSFAFSLGEYCRLHWQHCTNLPVSLLYLSEEIGFLVFSKF